MRIVIIRHADPDYAIDSITAEGHEEARLLGEYFKDKEVGYIYVSPMGRAKDTMQYILDAKGMSDYTVKEWLREFEYGVDTKNNELSDAYIERNVDEDGFEFPRVAWDMYPRALAADERHYDMNSWKETAVCRHSIISEKYDYVTAEFDRLLAEHGYVRQGLNYHCQQGNHDTITVICHFGVSMVLLSHLLHVSPYILWQGVCAAPTSITELVSEEREKGTATFRALRIGSTPHLEIVGKKPSFAARFCETYEDEDRH